MKLKEKKKILQNTKQGIYHEIILGIMVVLFCLYFTVASFLRYDNYFTGRLDLGNMTQTVWNTSEGRIFQQTLDEGIENESRLAYHADFILILFAPFYWIWESPKVLLLSQAIITGAGAIFIYLLAGRFLKNKNVALAFAFSYLINPSLGFATLFDFHPVTMATTFILAAIYFLAIKKYQRFFIFIFLAAITKEEVWLIAGLFGPILYFFHNKKKLGVLTFCISLFMFYFLIWKAIPWAAGTESHFAVSYFDNEGGSPSSIIKNFILSPNKTMGIILQKDRLEYLLALFLPLGFLPAFFPFWLILPGADIALNLLSSKRELQQIYYQYTSTITPFLYAAGIYAIYYVKKIFPKLPMKAIVLYIAGFALLAAYTYGPLPGSQNPDTEMFTNQLAYRQEFDEKLKEIPIENSVAASNELGAQLSHREYIYTLSIDVTDADYVAFFMREPDKTEIEFNQVLIDQLKNDRNYELWYDKYGLMIFKKINTESE